MKKPLWTIACTCFFAVLSVSAAQAQLATVKGKVTDIAGKPIVGATVELVNPETGRKYQLKTDKKGEYFSIGIEAGTYNVTLYDPDHKQLYSFNKFPVTLDPEGSTLDFDMAKLQAGQETAATTGGRPAPPRKLTPEQQKQLEEVRKKNEEIQKENVQIAELNKMIVDARTAETAGNWDQAASTLTQATTIAPNRDLLWGLLGDAYLGAGKNADKGGNREAASASYGKAAEAYEKAMALKPADGAYHNNLGSAYLKLHKGDQAAAEFAKAAEVDVPHAAVYYTNQAIALQTTGKIDEAVAAADKAIAADPNHADAYYWKGTSLIGKATTKDNKMVAPPGTEEALQKYIQLQPNGQFAEPAKQMLAAIGSEVETSYKKKPKK